MTYDRKIALERTNRSLSVAVVALALLSLISLAVGNWYGQRSVEQYVIDEIDTWHTARMYEDGSWVVNYKDGTGEIGCIATGLCQD